MDSSDVRKYYDEFMSERMLGYRIDGSLRINSLFRFASRYIPDRGVVADIGCGIGIVAELIAKRNPSIHVIGVDISENNIEYANRTISTPNIEFHHASVTEQFSILRNAAKQPVNMICLFDVIEHIPDNDRISLFSDLGELSSDHADMILTYPSPEYQRYLKKFKPEELQVIDNVIEIRDLLNEANGSGWKLVNFEYADVWMTNQYVYARLSKNIRLEDEIQDVGLAAKIWRKLDSMLLRPQRVKKYMKDPFKDWHR